MANNSVRFAFGVGVALWSCTAMSLSAQSVAANARPESMVKSRVVSVDVRKVGLERVLRDIAQQAGLRLFFPGEGVLPDAPVTVSVRNVQADEAFSKALAGTGLKAVIVSGNVYLTKTNSDASASAAQGSISGKVVDGRTRQGLRGATISIGGTNKETSTSNDGGFRFSGVVPGSYTIQVRMLGYVKASKSVVVTDGQTVSVEVIMEPSVNALDQVVVTGTVVSTELKAVPNAVTIITAKDLEQRGITRIDQLFHGDVPGLFAMNQGSGALLDEVTMFSRGATALSSSSAGTSLGTNPIKTYVDGVELADSKYLSQIDPKSIERIEILTGPQASTIYGSNAINGVMQIFTKRGTSARPQLTLNLQSGWVENNFSQTRTPQHDYSAQMNGVEGRLSYNTGGSWNYIGPWTPAKQTTRISVFGGTRLELPAGSGRVSADVTLRRASTRNRQHGDVYQTNTGYQESGWANRVGSGIDIPTMYELAGQTLGVTLAWSPTHWWSHELGVGQDASDLETRTLAGNYGVSASFGIDTLLKLSQTYADRRSLRYSTTARVPVTDMAQATVTLGADTWQNLTSSLTASSSTLTGSLTGKTQISRRPSHNTGGFLQTQLGVADHIFFTYGLRAEWNPDFGEDAQPNYAPRYGVAYTQDIGVVTAKVRGSYGRSTRPPSPGLKVARTASESGVGYYVANYGDFIYYLANPELGPEHQQGGEGGVELYWGTRGSLVITRYNQTVDGLIDSPNVDSVDLLPASKAQYGVGDWEPGYYVFAKQYLNIGSIRNQGWELQGSLHMGPVTTRGTYSWTKSRTIGVDPKYRTFFTPLAYPQYQAGSTFQYLPEHTWAVGVTYASRQTTVTLNVTGTGQIRNLRDEFYYQNLNASIRLPQNRVRMTTVGYTSFNKGYMLADITASRRLSSSVEGLIQVQNLADYYMNDYNAAYATIGRQGKIGLLLRL